MTIIYISDEDLLLQIIYIMYSLKKFCDRFKCTSTKLYFSSSAPEIVIPPRIERGKLFFSLMQEEFESKILPWIDENGRHIPTLLWIGALKL